MHNDSSKSRWVSAFSHACVLVAVGALAANAWAAAPKRPNILFLFTDDQPCRCLHCLGNTHIQTPNMDQLARDGVLFTNSFVTTSICCSNRACLLTGQYMSRNGIRDFKTPLSAAAFSQTYPALLRKAGYRTGYIGKFAIGQPYPQVRRLALPKDQFDFWYGFPQSINFKQIVDGKPRYLTTIMTEKATEFLQTNPKDQPFCLVVSLKEPHGPWNYFDPEVPDPYSDTFIPPPATFSQAAYNTQPKFLRDSLNGETSPKWLRDPSTYQQWVRTYYRLVTRADMAVGQIMGELKRLGLEDNTVVIFSSDNGELQGVHGLAGKWIMYEESIRVPLIIRDPRLPDSRQGQRCEPMVLSIDLAPTMLSLANVPVPDTMQGRDLTPLIAGKTVPWRDDWYYEHTYNTNPPRRPIVKCEGVRSRVWKYIRYPDTEPVYEQLFYVATDPQEMKNLAGQPEFADMLGRLRQRCDEYRISVR